MNLNDAERLATRAMAAADSLSKAERADMEERDWLPSSAIQALALASLAESAYHIARSLESIADVAKDRRRGER